MDITELISNVGFPIAAFMMMWFSNHTTLKKLTTAIDELKVEIRNGKGRE